MEPINFKVPILIIFIALFSIKIEGQSLFKDIKLDEIVNFNEKKADSILDTVINEEEKAKIYSIFFRFFYKKKKINIAIKYLKQEIKILDNQKKNSYYQHLILQLGYLYLRKNDLLKAERFLVIASKASYSKKRKGQALCLLGKCFFLRGDYNKSFNYYHKGINILKIHGKPTSIITYSLDIAKNSYFTEDKNHLKNTINFLKFSDALLKRYRNSLKNQKLATRINLNLANAHSQKIMESFDKANFYYKKALKEAKKINNNNLITSIIRNQGQHYLTHQKDSAFYFLNKSLNYCNQIDGLELIKANAYLNLSEFFYKKKNYLKALKNSYLAFDFFYTSNNKKFSEIYPEVLHQNNNRKNSSLITYKFNLKALIALIEKSSKLKEKYIDDAIVSIQNFDNLISVILDNDTNSESQFRWRKDASEIYNYAAYIYYLKKDYKSSFRYLEKNKAFLLAQNIDNDNINRELPKAILDKDKQYKKKILDLEYKITNKETKTVKDSLFDFRFSYQQFKDSIRTVFPKYFQLKSKTDLISLQEVQQNLDDDTVVVSYSIQNNNEENFIDTSIGLCISKNNILPFTLNSYTIKNEIQTFTKFIAKPLNNKNEIKQYNTVANSLYNSLFPTDEIKDLIQNKKVVIIPDDNLQNIPFEAFVTDTTSNRFLIENTDISYAYSMSFLNVNNNISRTSEKEFAGFAPVEFENKKLTTLQHSAEEINSINNNLNGITLTGENVTKDSFLTNASNAKIIHLATHANVSRKPVIHFSKDSLNLHELYTYKNNADLVVLSACETNVGELKRGEGILNLARGFFYSGSKSVVSSLWKVNDVATTELMTDFYTNLKDHQSKSEALNNAKRKYLKNHSLSQKSPYYWASFILIGDTNPTFESNYTIHYIIAISTLFLFFFIFLKKEGNKSKQDEHKGVNNKF
ncbi:CHAT domain-containing protein [Tenacibaculum jejuense]|uniref:CHAT domain-containing protein n=1 Tax=Tenacibaculum jejuense TaxID=584609 RepID=A0A238U7F8_9FLAO|nr:CHAT domain-containing protein [Tenacibaculum jejuense]SNR14985.1 Probable transmembrane protein of unknown function [Tenacibaculum jejuense]